MKNRKNLEKIKKHNNAEEQQKIADELEKKKESQEYTLSNMLNRIQSFWNQYTVIVCLF